MAVNASVRDDDEAWSHRNEGSLITFVNQQPHFITMLSNIIKQNFLDIPQNSDEYVYYGPWTSVLIKLFDIDEGFTICPQYQVPVAQGDKDTIDFVVTLVVKRNKAPIFFLEIKPPKIFDNRSARADTDKQMRRRFHQLYDASPSQLHGFSVFGTRCCHYSLNKETDNSIAPDPIPSNPQYVTDTAPEEWWTLDILDRTGYKKFSEVIQYVKGLGQDERKYHVFTHLSSIADVLVTPTVERA